MPDVARIWTRAEVLALPDDGHRYELVDGELLVTPGPSGPHQHAVWALYRLVDRYVREHRLGWVGQLLQPDLFVSAPFQGRKPLHWPEWGVPFLIAEVLSPSSARYDAFTKRRLYQRAGVSTCWVINLDGRLIDLWTSRDERPATIADRLVWQPDPSVPPLVIDLAAYFREVWEG